MSASSIHFSFELFPPRTPAGAEKLPAVVSRLAAVGPAFFSVTYGAGGSDQEGTYETVMRIAEDTGIETAPHLTCIGSTRAKIAALLQRYRDSGIRRIVALRGDLPATAASAAAPGEFRYASELVRFIRETHGQHFRLEVAAYPEMHPQAPNPDTDFENFRRKVEAGADGAVTQYFYAAEAYFDFMERCARAGITIPVVPGIMPITNFAQLTRFSAACGADIPRWIRLRLEQYQDDKQALLDFGLEVVTRLCRTLLDEGAPGLHFYTLNQAEPTLRLWKHLGLPVR
ncbi:5,10-methylenetetrahydrofolate reductase (NAD(P)) [Fontimonas thermophila]|uniref:Methylenetetrahydrofolate reductase n=1 Tax=Fontimonas thermophila TaxID=1076937 RepID=A0A1I2K260_9GAMM|nr:methylenetetrahydrofolate reductase [NAD(P)H] [Fontimonas thermophila]SFF59297.1 5,10-methylenetetrahydrofolate reductase (NAD(P)) [Fontimonas thermophila]